MRTYSVLERDMGEFKEVGRIEEREGKVLLVGFKDDEEKFYSKVGFGEKAYAPEDKDYIDVLIEKFALSSSIAIKLIEVGKGGHGSGSWDGPGKPRFAHQNKQEENKVRSGKFSIEFDDKGEIEFQLKEMGLSVKHIQDMCDLKEASKVELTIQSQFNGVYTIAEWYNKDSKGKDKRVGRFEIMLEDENDTFGTPKKAEITLLKADHTGIGLKEFYREAEAKLKSSGVKEIQLCADITIGRYFWAKEGYNFIKRREFLEARDKMKEFAEFKLKKLGKTKSELKDISSQIDKIKNVKEMALFDCGLLLKSGTWKITNEEVKADIVLHLGKAYMLDKDKGVGSWDAIKKLK